MMIVIHPGGWHSSRNLSQPGGKGERSSALIPYCLPSPGLCRRGVLSKEMLS